MRAFLKRQLVDLLGRRHDAFGWREGEAPLDPASVRTLLLLHTDAKLGDAIINSLLVDALHRSFPWMEITIGTSGAFRDYWSCHPGITRVLVIPERHGGTAVGRWAATRAAIRPHRDRFDVAVSFDSFPMFDTFAMLRYLRARHVVGFNKPAYRLFDYSLEESRFGVQAQHISSRIVAVLRVFGTTVDLRALHFHAPFSQADEREADAAIGPGDGPRLLLNAYGANAERTLLPASVRELLAHVPFEGCIYLSAPPGRAAEYDALGDPRVRVLAPMSGFPALFALVARMDAVVSPDSAVAHIAAVFRKPQVVLFSDRVNKPVVWRPMSDLCEGVVTTGSDVNVMDWDAVGAAFARCITHTLEAGVA